MAKNKKKEKDRKNETPVTKKEVEEQISKHRFDVEEDSGEKTQALIGWFE